ncbi:hypothetical protein HUK65_07905 [Rhodobacteraceae bacterium 2376]|uniref:Uncharacterized protein n=1 Tax=Rhabdonatronobacter sediminivivens TaxID=2743469 RepID=A0A7Z0HZ14_9RHOB|nr:hypothetical protein [Rhabdonatronobacter sediminivivens]NYS24916.1 hypothetical protein [Rhabdonatronobacter sediminivivens]
MDKSTVSGWRARRRVPTRFVKMLDEPGRGTFNTGEVSGELQERAYSIALARFVLLRHDLAASGEVNKSLPAFRQMLPFWLIVHRAVHDMLSTVESLQIDLDAAQVLILQDDLLHPERTKIRVARQLEEDLRDNPQLTGSGR